ncbi:cytochrome P450 [Nocardioides insulae]|uniref:cytochrome P450 n=1 Tax=Nocardioides insulae TaxID=394734 RepID=UPI00041386A0|nr:cytochrome P450 [Nocardioides insulae]
MLELSPTSWGLRGRELTHGTARRAAEPVKPVVRWGIDHLLPRQVMRRAAAKGDLQGRLIVESAGRRIEDLTDLFDDIRSRGPLHAGAISHITAHHGVLKEALGSPDVVSGIIPGNAEHLLRLSRWADQGVFHPLRPPSLLATEPPDHTRYRRLVTRVFTAKAVAGLRTRTEAIAADLLDGLEARTAAGEEIDLVEEYCGLLPVTVISEILGVPISERERVLAMGAGGAASLDMGLGWSEFRAVEASLARFEEWLSAHLERLRAEPGDNLLSQLIAASEDGVGLSEKELRATAGLVFAAGFETTVNLLGNGIALLHDHPEQLARLRAEPALWPNAVDEVLRYDPPVLITGRVVVRDTRIGGVEVPRGSVVTTVLAGANRDPAVFTDPDVFDVARDNAREHVSFSSGRHYCLGAALARMEGEVGLRALFDRFPDLTLRPDAGRRPTRILRGYAALPARLRPGSDPARLERARDRSVLRPPTPPTGV